MSMTPNIEEAEMFAPDTPMVKAVRLFGYSFFIMVLMVTAFRAGSLYQQVAVFHDAQVVAGSLD